MMRSNPGFLLPVAVVPATRWENGPHSVWPRTGVASGQQKPKVVRTHISTGVTTVRLSVAAVVVMAVGLGGAPPGGAQTLALGARPLVRVGALDSPSEEVFGRIQDIAIGSQGDLFVLDGLANDVRWFDAAGHFRGRAGRNGEGPGELSVPVAVAIDDAGLVHVLDARNRRIAVFAPTPRGLELQRENRVPFAADLCVAGSRRYLLLPSALGGGHLIHEVNDLGVTIGSFGDPDLSAREELRKWGRDAGMVAYSYERGSLSCDGRAGVIVLLSEVTSNVRAFSLDGAQLWRTELPDYRARSFVRSQRGGVTMRPDPTTGTAHTGTAVFFGGDFVYVVLHEASLADPEGSWELRILDRQGGKQLASQALPLGLVTQRAGRIVGFAQDPYPSVAVYSVR